VTSWFQEFNLWLYHSLEGAFYDVIIWCLGPFVDDSRDYGIVRCYLALVTRSFCRAWIARSDG
jgi:hypothetical protein